jgi:CRP/FNR family transcriptional regulator, cyclic AMP receptor protein
MREYSLGTLIDIDATLAAEHVSALAGAGRAVALGRNARIYRQGEPADDVWFLSSGKAKSVLVGQAGDETLLRLHLAHSLLGLTALGSQPVRDADAVAITDAELVRIPGQSFEALLLANPGLARRVIALLVDRMRDFHHRVGDFLGLSVEQRLARALLSLSRPDPQDGADAARRPIHLTHEELASLTNARRPTVTATLRRLALAGCIAREGRAVVVRDERRLAAFAGAGA